MGRTREGTHRSESKIGEMFPLMQVSAQLLRVKQLSAIKWAKQALMPLLHRSNESSSLRLLSSDEERCLSEAQAERLDFVESMR